MANWPPTLAETKTALNKADNVDDTELGNVIAAAVAMLENHPAYRITDVAKQITHTEWRDGAPHDEIVLRHYPVASVTSITEYTPAANTLSAEPLDTTVTFTSNGYQIDTAAGIVTRTSAAHPCMFRGRVKLVYVVGNGTAPDDLHEAALMLIDHIWETQRGGVGAQAEPVGLNVEDRRGTYAAQFGPSYALPDRVREMLEPYRADLHV